MKGSSVVRQNRFQLSFEAWCLQIYCHCEVSLSGVNEVPVWDDAVSHRAVEQFEFIHSKQHYVSPLDESGWKLNLQFSKVIWVVFAPVKQCLLSLNLRLWLHQVLPEREEEPPKCNPRILTQFCRTKRCSELQQLQVTADSFLKSEGLGWRYSSWFVERLSERGREGERERGRESPLESR